MPDHLEWDQMTWAKTSVQAPRPSKQEKEHKEPHNLMLRSLFGSNCDCNQCVPSHYATTRHCHSNRPPSDLEVKTGKGYLPPALNPTYRRFLLRLPQDKGGLPPSNQAQYTHAPDADLSTFHSHLCPQSQHRQIPLPRCLPSRSLCMQNG